MVANGVLSVKCLHQEEHHSSLAVCVDTLTAKKNHPLADIVCLQQAI